MGSGRDPGRRRGPVRLRLRETTPATDVTETSATLSGNVRSSLEDQTVWWFAWGTTTAYGRETPHRTVAISGQGAHPVAETLTGLEPDTTYHYKLCAMDPAHQKSGACGGDKTVTTAAVGSYRDEVLADGPVGYWRLGESGGTTAASETGTNPGIYMNGVTLGRPGAITGDPSSAAGLDGIDDTVRVPKLGGTRADRRPLARGLGETRQPRPAPRRSCERTASTSFV